MYGFQTRQWILEESQHRLEIDVFEARHKVPVGLFSAWQAVRSPEHHLRLVVCLSIYKSQIYIETGGFDIAWNGKGLQRKSLKKYRSIVQFVIIKM